MSDTTGAIRVTRLPSGLTVSANTLATCGGTLTTSIPGTITLTGASIAAGGNCQFQIQIDAEAIAGDFTGHVDSTRVQEYAN